MMKPTRVTLALVAMTLFPTLVPVNALAFTDRFGVRVGQVNAAVFEVVPKGGGGASFWCGASEHARLKLGAGWRTAIYIARGLGPSETTGRRSAVQFTLDPNAAGITPTGGFVSRNSLSTGESLTVQQANRLCEHNPTRN